MKRGAHTKMRLFSLLMTIMGSWGCESSDPKFSGESYLYLIRNNLDTLKFYNPFFEESSGTFGKRTSIFGEYGCSRFIDSSCTDTNTQTLLIYWENIGGKGTFELSGGYAYGQFFGDFSAIDSGKVHITDNTNTFLAGHAEEVQFYQLDSNLSVNITLTADIIFNVSKVEPVFGF